MGGSEGRSHAKRTGELLDPAENTVYRQCVGGLLHNTQDRADAQDEVSILGSMLGKPTQGSMIALKRVPRYLKGTRDFVNKLELDIEVDEHVVRLDGFSGSDWAGSTDRKSQSSGALFVDGAPLYSFSRRQSVIATSSGMAEFYAGCATAEEMQLARNVLIVRLPSRSVTSHGQRGSAWHLQTRRCREGQSIGSASVVVATGDQSQDTHARGGRDCKEWSCDVRVERP